MGVDEAEVACDERQASGDENEAEHDCLSND